MQRYKKDLKNNSAKKTFKDLGNNRAIKRRRYEQNAENNRTKKRIRYSQNFQHESDRQKINCNHKWLYNKRYYEKKKLKPTLKKNYDIAKNILY